MDENQGRDVYLTSAEESDIVEYHPLCRTALVALILGVASVTVLTSLLLLPIGILSIAFAVLALWQISRSESVLAGKWAAVVGLALGIVFTTAAMSKTTARTMVVRQQARELSDEWLTMVRNGELYRAHQLHLPPDKRQLPSVSLSAYYGRSEVAQEQFAEYFRSGPNAELAEARQKGQVTFLGLRRHITENKQDVLAYHYDLSLESAEPLQTIPFEVVVSRLETDSGPRWRVIGAMPLEP